MNKYISIVLMAIILISIGVPSIEATEVTRSTTEEVNPELEKKVQILKNRQGRFAIVETVLAGAGFFIAVVGFQAAFQDDAVVEGFPLSEFFDVIVRGVYFVLGTGGAVQGVSGAIEVSSILSGTYHVESPTEELVDEMLLRLDNGYMRSTWMGAPVASMVEVPFRIAEDPSDTLFWTFCVLPGWGHLGYTLRIFENEVALNTPNRKLFLPPLSYLF